MRTHYGTQLEVCTSCTTNMFTFLVCTQNNYTFHNKLLTIVGVLHKQQTSLGIAINHFIGKEKQLN